MQTCYSISYKDHYLEADQNTIFNVSPLFLHSSENTLISNWTWQWAYPLSRCCKRKDSSRNKTARGPVPVAWGVHSIGPRGPKYLNSWPVLWYLNCILQKPTVQMGTALSAAGGSGGEGGRKRKIHNDEEFWRPDNTTRKLEAWSAIFRVSCDSTA